MAHEQLFMIHGTGSDTTGLVGSITTPLAEAGGNIVDLRQDVLHGLFTIFLVVDLSNAALRPAELETLVRRIAGETGLELAVDRYHPIPRTLEHKNMLVILLGTDKPGIIAAISKTLGKYGVNIELVQSIGREGLFLTELMTEVSHCTIPIENLKTTLGKLMKEINIRTFFQTEDVFNKKKRVLLFNFNGSLIDRATIGEIIQQTDLTQDLIDRAYSRENIPSSLQTAAGCLNGLPADTLNAILSGVQPRAGVIELVQTLKTMGYKVALASIGFSPFIEGIKNKSGLDYAYSVQLPIDHDEQVIVGEIEEQDCHATSLDAVIADLIAREAITRDDVAILDDLVLEQPVGIRLQFELDQLLGLYNNRALSRENLLGVLGSFGIL